MSKFTREQVLRAADFMDRGCDVSDPKPSAMLRAFAETLPETGYRRRAEDYDMALRPAAIGSCEIPTLSADMFAIAEQAYRRGYFQGYFSGMEDSCSFSAVRVRNHLSRLHRWRYRVKKNKSIFPPVLGARGGKRIKK